MYGGLDVNDYTSRLRSRPSLWQRAGRFLALCCMWIGAAAVLMAVFFFAVYRPDPDVAAAQMRFETAAEQACGSPEPAPSRGIPPPFMPTLAYYDCLTAKLERK